MKRTKFAIFTLLVALVSAMCFALIACGGDNGTQGATYKITWTVADHATVAATGYDTLPTELAENTEVTFTVTPEAGYAVSAVTPSTAVKKQSDGSYKFTATKDLEIKVVVREIVDSLTVTKPTKMTYFAGEAVDTKGMVVTVNYATNRSEATEDYIIEYANGGEAFALGETGFNVTYGGVSETVEFDSAIVGKVTLDLYGGELADEDIAKLQQLTGYEFDQTNGIISWTFAQAFAEDFVLPTPTKTVDGNGFPFIRWSGVTDNKIAKDTAISLNIVALYDAQLVQVESLEFTKKSVTETVGEGEEAQERTVLVPYFIIKGKFVAATEAYLYLYEGNADIELKGDTVTKTDGSADFTLEFDLRKLVDARGSWKEDNEEKVDQPFTGKWMDIKFCAKLGTREETQEINLNNYDADFVDINANVVAKHNDAFYQFSYRTHSPKAGDSITGVDGATYDGTEKLLKLVYEDSIGIAFTGVTLELRDRDVVGEDEQVTKVPTAYAVIAGEAADESMTKEELQTIVNDIYVDAESMGSWKKLDFEKSIVVNDDLTFTISMNLNNGVHGYEYFMHTPKAGNNFAIKVTPGTVKAGDFEYTLYNNVAGDWTNGLVFIKVKDTTASEYSFNQVALEERDGKAMIVFTGTYENYTVEQLQAFVIDGEVSGRTQLTLTVEVDEQNGTFTMTADLAQFTSEGFHYLHGGPEAEPGNISASVCAIVDGKGEITVNGKKYTLGEQWGTRGVTIATVTPDPEPAE